MEGFNKAEVPVVSGVLKVQCFRNMEGTSNICNASSLLLLSIALYSKQYSHKQS